MINEKQNPKVLKKQHDTKRLYLVVAIIIVFFSIITFLAVYNLLLTKKPEVSTDVPFATTPLDAAAAENDEIEPDNSVVMGGITYTRRKDVYNFLVAGESDQTDTMMIIQYDVGNQKIAVVQIPRDTYINAGRNFHKINSYYTGEYNLAIKSGVEKSKVKETAMTGLASMIEQNLNIKIDYWILVSTEAFANIVDIIGGVEIDVQEDMFYEDPEQNLYIDIKAGLQVLYGHDAEGYVRYRDGYALADKGRMDAQKIFMTALVQKVKQSLSIDTVTKMIQEAITHVDTSLTAQECIYFATEIFKIDFNNISMMSLNTTSVYYSSTGAWYEVLNRNDTLKMINEYLNVYEQKITSSIFDINKVFTNESIKVINETYNSESSAVDTYTAEEIAENSISITFK